MFSSVPMYCVEKYEEGGVKRGLYYKFFLLTLYQILGVSSREIIKGGRGAINLLNVKLYQKLNFFQPQQSSESSLRC